MVCLCKREMALIPVPIMRINSIPGSWVLMRTSKDWFWPYFSFSSWTSRIWNVECRRFWKQKTMCLGNVMGSQLCLWQENLWIHFLLRFHPLLHATGHHCPLCHSVKENANYPWYSQYPATSFLHWPWIMLINICQPGWIGEFIKGYVIIQLKDKYFLS